jgi:atypical dual specificity phosphatase
MVDKAKTKQVNEILPHLYLTSVYGATRDNIYTNGVRVLINSARELPKQEHDGVQSLKLYLDDHKSEVISVHFDWISDIIHEHVTNYKSVMIHCVMGISRSTTLVLAYLMKYHRMNLKDAINFVRSKRTIIRYVLLYFPKNFFFEKFRFSQKWVFSTVLLILSRCIYCTKFKKFVKKII